MLRKKISSLKTDGLGLDSGNTERGINLKNTSETKFQGFIMSSYDR